MPYDNLPEFLARLQDAGELRRVSVEVDPQWEITEIASRIQRPGQPGPALMFERVRHSPLSLIVNLFASPSRILRAFDASSYEELQHRVAGNEQNPASEGWLQKLKALGTTGSHPWKPNLVKTAICQQVVKVGRDIDLRELPGLQNWPDEAGRFLHGCVALFRHPETGRRCVESFPLQIIERSTLGIYSHAWQAASQALAAHQRVGTQFPMAIAIGGDPVWSLLPSIPVPVQGDPVVYAGSLRGQGLDVVRGRQVDLEVPAGAEIVLEGYFDAQGGQTRGGAVGQDNGCYGSVRDVPEFHVTCVTHRGNPVVLSALSGRPEFGADALRELTARLGLPMLQLLAPGVTQLAFPRGFGQDSVCVVSLRKTYPHQARQVMHAVWSWAQTLLCKWVIVVDDEINPEDGAAVWRAVVHHTHAPRDLSLHDGPVAPSEHANPVAGLGSHVGIDATRKLPDEGHPRPWPEALALPQSIRDLVTQRWREYGL